MGIYFKLHPLSSFQYKSLKKRLSDLAFKIGPPQEGNDQKINFPSETAGLVSQNRPVEKLDFGESGYINEEEHQKTDYAVVDDSDVPVDKSPHK